MVRRRLLPPHGGSDRYHRDSHPQGAPVQFPPLEFHTTSLQLDAPVPQPSHRHLLARQSQPGRRPIQLIPPALVNHRPIPLHHPLDFPTQCLLPPPRHRLVYIRRTGRRHLESLIEFGQIGLRQIRVGPAQIINPGQPQRLHQPVLQHAVHPFHPPFGLRTVGQDQLHPQFFHRPPKLGLGPFPGDLLGNAAHSFTPIDAVPVHIQALGQPIPSGPAFQHVVAGVCRLGFKELGPHPVGGIIHHHHQHARRPSSLEPVVVRTVQLHHRPKAGFTLPPLPVALPAAAHGPSPGGQQEASQIAARQKVVTQSHEAIAQFVTAVRKTCFCRKEMLFRS
ncbi:MAG: hypothetical protein BWX84_00157 [Verrucomicrobia bacterium ADurb.Bin118]|nr:MAG: hypothetical protein BWX84_00157 [Verrucomicrobia bacterium ADurb.Bin118]